MVPNLPREMPALDGLRGIAILMVILTHVGAGWQAAMSIVADTKAWEPTFDLPRWLSAIAGEGFHGVTLFFVVSAFTLTVSAGRRDDGLLAYAARRLARVGPGYWLAGIGYTLVAGLAPRLWAPNGVNLQDLAVAAVFGSAWQGGASNAVVPGGWSVSCEVAFYVTFPAMLWLVAWKPWRAILLAGVIAMAVQVWARQSMIHHAWIYVPDYVRPIVQAPVFAFGIAAAVLAQRYRMPRLPGVALAFLLLAVAGLPLVHTPWWMLRHVVFAALATGAVILVVQHGHWLLERRTLTLVGKVSYSMYLVHFALLVPSLTVAEWLAPGDRWPTFAVHFLLTTGASYGLACVTFGWIEHPCSEWVRDALRGRRHIAAE